MTPSEIDTLKSQNIDYIEQMNTASGSMIQAVLDGITDTRNTPDPCYIRLTAVSDHKAHYEVLEGDESVIGRVARSLGVIPGIGQLVVRN